jgi:hypothetical protein
MADGNSSPVTPNHAADPAEHGVDNKTPPPDTMPPPPPGEPRLLEIHFNGSGGESVTFKLKEVTRLRKAMDAYSARVQRPVKELRFIFDGTRLVGDDTPAAVSTSIGIFNPVDHSLTLALARDGGRRHCRGPHGAARRWRPAAREAAGLGRGRVDSVSAAAGVQREVDDPRGLPEGVRGDPGGARGEIASHGHLRPTQEGARRAQD